MALDPEKLARLDAAVSSMAARLDALCAKADAEFDESKHPRGGDGKFGGGSSRPASGEWEKKGQTLRMGYSMPNGKTRFHTVDEIGPGEVYTTVHGATRRHASVEAAKTFVEDTIAQNKKHNEKS